MILSKCAFGKYSVPSITNGVENEYARGKKRYNYIRTNRYLVTAMDETSLMMEVEVEVEVVHFYLPLVAYAPSGVPVLVASLSQSAVAEQ
jgi:hypothetical protein